MTSAGQGFQAVKLRSRYPAIDILRGLALVSMVSSHILRYQLDSTIGTVFHKGQWIDGAFFFVALSGVVVGLVHRRIAERSGLRPSVVKLVRRAGFLYLVHVALALFAIGAAWLDDDDLIVGAPPWTGLADVPRVLARVLLLRLEPADNGVLPIYVVFLLLAIPAVALLRQGRWRAVVTGSLAIYCAGWLVGGVSFVPGEFSLTAWQALFIGGLLVGWSWEHERLQLAPVLRRQIVALASLGAAGFLAMALVAPGRGGRLFGDLLDKMLGGPLAFAYAAVVLVAGYVAVDRLLQWRWAATLLTPVRILGSKGLPGYAALQVCAVFVDLFPGLPRNDVLVIAVVIVCGITEYVAVRWQERRRRARLERPDRAVAPSDVAPTVIDLRALDRTATGPADIAGPEPVAADAAADGAGMAVPPFRDVVEVDDEGPGGSERVPLVGPGQLPTG